MTLSWLLFPVALLAGALVTAQTGSNTRLKEAFGAPLPAVIVSSLLGIAALLAVAVAMRSPWPSLGRVAEAPWSAWLGGLLGATYAVVTVVLAHDLGAATLTALLVTGQLVCSVVLDHLGWLGFEPHPVNVWRVAGCGLMIVGLILISRF